MYTTNKTKLMYTTKTKLTYTTNKIVNLKQKTVNRNNNLDGTMN